MLGLLGLSSTAWPSRRPKSRTTSAGMRRARLFPQRATFAFITHLRRRIYAGYPRRTSLHPLLAPAHGGDAGARDFGKADRGHELDEALDLVRGPGELEHEGAEGGVEDAGPEGRGEAHCLHPVLAGADDLEERELALDRLALDRQIVDPVHGHEPLELALDLLDHSVGARGHDGDARDVLLVLGLGDGQALDVVAAAREHAGDPRQHARLVVDDNR